tara:strand:+ start:14887 stop:16110 length:1224 start_codon:yes stop_codon:yes gene_type:complete
MILIFAFFLVGLLSALFSILILRRYSALYIVLTFLFFLILFISFFLLFEFPDNSLSTFDGIYYLERLNLYRQGVLIGGDSSLRIRDVGFDLFINYFFKAFDCIYPLTSPISYYLALAPNILSGCLLVLALQEYVSSSISRNFLSLPFFCPYIIAFSISLDREIVIALCVCLFAIFSCSTARFAFPALALLSFFLLFLRPSMLFVLLAALVLRYLFLSFNLSTSYIKLFVFALFLSLIFSPSFFFGSESFALVRTNFNAAGDTSGLLGAVLDYPPVLRGLLYLIASFLTPLFDSSLLLTSPIDFILSFSALWKLFILYLLAQLFVTRGFKLIFTDSNSLFLIFSLCIGYFFYSALLFNNRHIAQLVPLAYISIFYISNLSPVRNPSKLLLYFFLMISSAYFFYSLVVL